MHTGHADKAHNETGQHNAQGNRQAGGLDAHVQERRSQGAGPGTGTGQGDAHEQHQRDKQALASGLCRQLLAATFTLFNAVGEELADVFLVAAPQQNLPGEEIDDGNRQHIADGADDQSCPVVQTHQHCIRHTATKLNERNHRNDKCDQIFF